MEDILQEFVIETNESIEQVDAELVRFEQAPDNREILAKIFRLVHTVKGTCGFLGLPRLEALSHAAESAISAFRDGEPVTQQAVSLILTTIDRIRMIIAELENSAREPSGADEDLIQPLKRVQQRASGREQEAEAQGHSAGSLVYQVLERPLKPGEASLDDLERAFRETPGPEHAKLDAGAARQADKAAPRKTIRVSLETIENLMTMVSELVLTRNQLMELSRGKPMPEFSLPFQRLSQITGELQDSIAKARMQPIGAAWASLPRVVRDTARDLGKDAVLEMHGGETEIDRQVLELIKDPFLHMMRNAVDHGIESPERRRAAGKPERAVISLRAALEAGGVVIEVSDDGKGLDVNRIRDSAVRSGAISQAEALSLSAAEAADLIFRPGLSTASSISAISGRGIGMDVVRANIEQCGGSIAVQSQPGRGTRFTIRIPVSLSIVTALMVEAGGQIFAMPQGAIAEIIRPGEEGESEEIGGSRALKLRDGLIPYARLADFLKLPAEPADSAGELVVICQLGGRRFGIAIAAVHQSEEIVIKPLAGALRGISAFSGAAILGNGAIALALEPESLAAAAGIAAEEKGGLQAGKTLARPEAEAQTERLIVFRAGADGCMAVPAGLVTRLEEIDAQNIQVSGSGWIAEYRGRLITVIPAAPDVTIRKSGMQPVLIVSRGSETAGLAVDAIIDVVEERLAFDIQSEGGLTLGTAIIGGRATGIIDPAAVLPFLQRSGSAPGPASRHVLMFGFSEFCRALLGPVIQAQGWIVAAETDRRRAQELLSGRNFAAVIADLDASAPASLDLAGAAAAGGQAGKPEFIGIASAKNLDLIGRARAAGFADIIGAFDRQGLAAALQALGSEGAAAA